jgi:pyruvate formate lyase activating enzyme
MKEALLYEKIGEARVRCNLCAHRCLIAAGKRGLCQVRENRDGTLYSLVYGQVISQALDPIEKKPLFHFHPGSTVLSIATVGCNLTCAFCQNADISQMPRDARRIGGRTLPADAIIVAAQRYHSPSIAYTYSEPTIFFEYAYDIGLLAHQAGIANVWVSNGFMTPEMLEMMTSSDGPPLIDAANVDLKAFRDDFYRQECGARLQPVLDTLKLMKKRRVWLEVTTLLIPGLNDSDTELNDIAQFITTELGADTPWHVSRFHPSYRMTDRPPTPVSTIHRARELGLQAGLHYVYEGNVPDGVGEDTLCPQCQRTVIRRLGFAILDNQAHGGVCGHCGASISGIGL